MAEISMRQIRWGVGGGRGIYLIRPLWLNLGIDPNLFFCYTIYFVWFYSIPSIPVFLLFDETTWWWLQCIITHSKDFRECILVSLPLWMKLRAIFWPPLVVHHMKSFNFKFWISIGAPCLWSGVVGQLCVFRIVFAVIKQLVVRTLA